MTDAEIIIRALGDELRLEFPHLKITNTSWPEPNYAPSLMIRDSQSKTSMIQIELSGGLVTIYRRLRPDDTIELSDPSLFDKITGIIKADILHG